VEAWNDLPGDVRKTKDVRFNPLGDLYPPDIVTTFKEKRQLTSEPFPRGHAHADKKEYEKDLTKSKPAVFEEWQAWPEGNMHFVDDSINEIRSEVLRAKFRKMINIPEPSRFGWVYPMTDLKCTFSRLKY
jgi:hypothetical protein